MLELNSDEEKTAMVLEWIRRNDPAMDTEVKDYWFTRKKLPTNSMKKFGIQRIF